MNQEMNRREFFCALGRSAIAAGVTLAVGLEPLRKGVYTYTGIVIDFEVRDNNQARMMWKILNHAKNYRASPQALKQIAKKHQNLPYLPFVAEKMK